MFHFILFVDNEKSWFIEMSQLGLAVQISELPFLLGVLDFDL